MPFVEALNERVTEIWVSVFFEKPCIQTKKSGFPDADSTWIGASKDMVRRFT